jgi:hypothetical protein
MVVFLHDFFMDKDTFIWTSITVCWVAGFIYLMRD